MRNNRGEQSRKIGGRMFFGGSGDGGSVPTSGGISVRGGSRTDMTIGEESENMSLDVQGGRSDPEIDEHATQSKNGLLTPVKPPYSLKTSSRSRLCASRLTSCLISDSPRADSLNWWRSDVIPSIIWKMERTVATRRSGSASSDTG